MPFRINLGNGVRLSATSQGLRMTAGPRIARVSVGGGRQARISSGFGPVTYYTNVGGQRRSTQGSSRANTGRQGAARQPNAGPTRSQLLAQERAARRAAAEEQFRALETLERHLTTLHLETFAATVAPPDPGPEPVNQLQLLSWLQEQDLAAIGRQDPAARQWARDRAHAALPQALAAEQQRRWQEYQDRRAASVEAYEALLANDPGAVLDALEAAFADNESDAVAVNCEPVAGGRGGAAASLVVVMSAVDELPDRKPVRSPTTGAPTTPKRTKKELNDLYARWLGSTVLATSRRRSRSRRG